MDLNLSPQQIAAADEQYQRLKPTVETKYPGQYIVIDPLSKEYWVAPFLAEAFRMAKIAYPERLFYSYKIGSETALKR